MEQDIAYMEWLCLFTEKTSCFSDQDWYYYQSIEEDSNNMAKIGRLFKQIDEYAKEKNINPDATISGYNYTIKYKNKIFIVGMIYEGRPFYYCHYMRLINKENIINYYDVLKNEMNKEKILVR